MSSKKTHKRKRGNNPMIDGDLSSARFVTFETITETRKDGTMGTKRVMVSLDTPSIVSTTSNISTTDEIPAEDFSYNHEPENNSPPPSTSKNTYRVGKFYNHISLFLILCSVPKRLPPAICRSNR
jgi:hypothetical protein